ncbi:hypothetical protein ABT234_20960 [Streptomyces sp. NPDC001586]|uniref:hypothetical protein n=1 Tax=Streptomyces sp. NPDC001586 TaxID=3154387 RepID=UPI003331B047
MSTAEEPAEPSRAAGGCVLTVVAAVSVAAVFAVSPDAGVLAVWVVGAAVLVRAARRPVSDSSATPPPLPETPSGDVYAGEVLRVDRVERGPEGVMCTVHVVREEVNGP